MELGGSLLLGHDALLFSVGLRETGSFICSGTCYGVFTPEQDNDKTTTRQMLNLCIPMMPFTPGPTNLVGSSGGLRVREANSHGAQRCSPRRRGLHQYLLASPLASPLATSWPPFRTLIANNTVLLMASYKNKSWVHLHHKQARCNRRFDEFYAGEFGPFPHPLDAPARWRHPNYTNLQRPPSEGSPHLESGSTSSQNKLGHLIPESSSSSLYLVDITHPNLTPNFPPDTYPEMRVLVLCGPRSPHMINLWPTTTFFVIVNV